MFPHRHKRLVAWLDPGSKLPWWAGVALAGLAYFGLENLSVPAGPDGAQPAMLAVGRYLLTAVFLAVALRSAYGRLRRRRSHIAASGRPGAALPGSTSSLPVVMMPTRGRHATSGSTHPTAASTAI